MGSGKLDQRVTFQSRNSASDGAGGSSPQWANFASVPTVWARVEPQGGGEAFENDRTNATMRARVTIRYRDDVSEGDRLLWLSDPYNIRGIMREGARPLYLVLECERGVPSGN